MNAPPRKSAKDVDFGIWDHRPQLLEYLGKLLLEHRAYVDAAYALTQVHDPEALDVVMRGFHATTGPIYANVKDYKAMNAKEGA